MSQKKIGAKIVIDGEQEFRSALQQSKNALKEFDSELKLVSAQFKNNERSMDALKAKQAVYQKQQQELTKTSKILVEQIQKANTAYKSAEEAQAKQAEHIKKLEKALEDARKQYGENSDEVERLERELSEANVEYEKQGRQLTSLSNKITKWNTELNKTQTELVQTDAALDDTNQAIERFDDGMEDAETETKKFGITMNGASEGTDKLKVSLGSLVSAQVVVDVLRNCARAIKEVAEAAIEVGMKFESSMSNVEALSGASGDALERLSEKAREMGSQTIYSASESADALSYMALAGWNVEQMLEGIEPVLSLAAAANMDLAEASDIVTDYITAFGLKASDAAHFSDAMARAMSTSNTTVELLAESYKNCAATCGSMGIAMEDATAVLATMANAGVKGGEAGTALNTILTRLATNTKNCADKLKDYGIAVYDAEGNMNSISSILNGLGDIWGTLSDKEQAALAKTIAGTQQYSRFQTIMLGVSEAAKEGGQSFDDYAESLRNCDGAAEAMAKTMQDNLAGDITILKSALEGLGIATEGVFDDTFRDAVQGATDAVAKLEYEVSHGNLGVSLAELGDALGKLVDEFFAASEDAIPGFIDGLTWIIKHLDEIKGVLTVAISSLVAYKVATIAATIETGKFTAAIASNPIGAMAVALTAACVATYELTSAYVEANNVLTESQEEMTRVAEEAKALSGTIRDSITSRKDEVAQMELQAASSHKLVAELFNESTARERKLQIIGQLSALYPGLNLSLNEEGRIIGATNKELDRYIDLSLKTAKVEAAKEHLTEIAKEQFDAEQELVKVTEQKKRAEEEYQAAVQRRDSVGHLSVSGQPISMQDVGLMTDVQEAEERLNNLRAEEIKLKATTAELGSEYQQTLDYIDDNGALVEATESTEELTRAEEEARIASEALAEEFNELEKSIAQSIGSSLDLTNKWAQEWKTSTQQMNENIDSQIEGIEKWKDNFELLANSAEVNIDQRVLKYLADMGVEGAGLVQELVNTLEKSPEELQGFSDKMAQYLSLEDTVAAEITDSYESAVKDGTNKAAEAVANNSGAVAGATQEMADEIAAKMTNVGHDAVKAVEEAFDESADDVQAAAKQSGDKVIDGFTEELGQDGEKVGEIGKAADKALADAFLNGKAKDSAETVSQEIYDAVASNLSTDSGYKIGENFMSGLSSAIDTLGKNVIAAAQAIASKAQQILNSVPLNPPGGNVPPGHADGLAYVPYDNYLARLHEGERVLTKEENAEYSALLGAAKAPSFNVIQSGLDGMADNRAIVINNDIKVDGAQDPELWTQTFIRTLKREARMV